MNSPSEKRDHSTTGSFHGSASTTRCHENHGSFRGSGGSFHGRFYLLLQPVNNAPDPSRLKHVEGRIFHRGVVMFAEPTPDTDQVISQHCSKLGPYRRGCALLAKDITEGSPSLNDARLSREGPAIRYGALHARPLPTEIQCELLSVGSATPTQWGISRNRSQVGLLVHSQSHRERRAGP